MGYRADNLEMGVAQGSHHLERLIAPRPLPEEEGSETA